MKPLPHAHISLSCAVAAIIALATCFTASGNEPAADTDGDGMSDPYEFLFGLNPNSAADAALDPDGDGLTNAQEAQLWTDPGEPDTDRDGLPDGQDPAPLSRIYIRWGDPRYVQLCA